MFIETTGGLSEKAPESASKSPEKWQRRDVEYQPHDNAFGVDQRESGLKVVAGLELQQFLS